MESGKTHTISKGMGYFKRCFRQYRLPFFVSLGMACLLPALLFWVGHTGQNQSFSGFLGYWFLWLVVGWAGCVLCLLAPVEWVGLVAFAGAIAQAGYQVVQHSGLAAFSASFIQFTLWFGPGAAMTLGKMLIRDRRARFYQVALDGVVSVEAIERIVEDPSVLNVRPMERVVSILFLDTSEFSIVSESRTPKEVFAEFKDFFDGIQHVIHAHGGFIQKVLGDGLLCCFGHSLTDLPPDPKHAHAAIQCAMAIQEACLNRILNTPETGFSPYSVRIGIHTANVFIGNLGNRVRYDLAMIGAGVHFASRLEAACEPFKILASSSTRAMLQQEDLPESLAERWIKVEAQKELVETYEVDPFKDQVHRVTTARRILRRFDLAARRETRQAVPPDVELYLETEYGRLVIEDFSLSGLCVWGEKFFAKGVMLSGTLSTPQGSMLESLAGGGLSPLNIEVCWGRARNDTYVHGCTLKGLNDEQKKTVFRAIRETIEAQRAVLPKPSQEAS